MFLMPIKLYLALSFFTFHSGFTYARANHLSCADLLSQEYSASKSQKSEISRTLERSRQKDSDLEVRVFNFYRNEKKQTLILLGESHTANAEDSEHGRNLIDQFENIGIEGDNENQELFGVHTAKVRKASNYLSVVLQIFGSLKFFVYESLKSGQRPNDFSSSPMMYAFTEPNIVTHNMESEGPRHFNDELRTLSLSSYLSAGTVCELGCLVKGTSYIFGSEDLKAFILFSALTGLHWVVTYAFQDKLLKFLSSTLMTERDLTISKGIPNLLEQFPKQETFLVILGKNHLPGVSGHLLELENVEEITP